MTQRVEILNYHSDIEIMNKVRQNFIYAKDNFLDERINVIGAFYIGSANYGLDKAASDADIRLLVAPSITQIALMAKPISTTFETPWGDHVEVKDVRMAMREISKQNINAVEILLTPYKIIEDNYKILWYILEKDAETFCRINPYNFVNSVYGVLHQWIQKPVTEKTKERIVFYYEALVKYINNYPMKECITFTGPVTEEYLKDIVNFKLDNPYENKYDAERLSMLNKWTETILYASWWKGEFD